MSIFICLFLIANALVITGGADDNDTIIINIHNFGPRWDINQDGICDGFDVSMLVAHYKETGSPGWLSADINLDGIIDTYDVSAIVNHFGESWIS